MQLGAHQSSLDVSSLHPLFEHVLLKILLNTHFDAGDGSPRPVREQPHDLGQTSNNKLIDRAIRYVAYLLARDDVHPVFSYEDIACQCF